MKNPLVQGLILIAVFIGFWFALSQIDWKPLLRTSETKQDAEKKLGKLIFSTFESKIVHRKSVVLPLDSIKLRLCKANNIDPISIRLYVVRSSEINAFALPYGYIMVNTALIESCKNEEALAGVLAHEIAHIQKKHIVKKLIKELGSAVIINITTNGAGGEIMREMLHVLTSTAYDRSLEAEADQLATKYLCSAKIDALPFADFLKNMESNNDDEALKWLSTHPDNDERASQIESGVQQCETKTERILATTTWETLLEKVKD